MSPAHFSLWGFLPLLGFATKEGARLPCGLPNLIHFSILEVINFAIFAVTSKTLRDEL